MNILNNVTQLVGNTPLIRIDRLKEAYKVNSFLFGKLEMFNLTGSVKDRPALFMIEAAEKQGLLKKGGTIIEATSGNTGIGLAAIGISKGYQVILTMPETMSKERQSLLKAYGAKIVLTSGKLGMKGSLDKAVELNKSIEGSFICSQFSNKNNPLAHYSTTGPEIWEAMDGDVDVFIAGVGTGGTISGVGKFLKEKNPNIKIIAVEPKKSPVLSGKKAGPHNLQGIGANFVPDNFDRSVVDEIMQIDEESSYKGMRDLSQYEGILAGITSGSALAAALKVSARSEYKNKNIVIMFPDTGSRYLSTGLFEE